MKKLLKKIVQFFLKALAYIIYFFSRKIDINLLRSEVAAKLGSEAPSSFIICQKTITPMCVLVIKIKDNSSKSKLICKIPLNASSLEKLKTNYDSLVELSSFSSNLIPKPMGEIINNKYNVFLETWVEGYNAYDMYQKKEVDGDPLLWLSKQALFHIRNSIFNQIEPPTIISNKILFLQLVIRFIECMPNNIPYDLRRLFQKVEAMWNTRGIQCGLSHGDLWFGNIIVSNSNELKIQGIIDWDRLDHNIPMLFDEIHLETYYLAMEGKKSVGREIINCINNKKYELEDALIYWLLFILKSRDNINGSLSGKRWMKRNVYDMLGFLEQMQ